MPDRPFVVFPASVRSFLVIAFGLSLVAQHAGAQPIVMLDSFHAHNFIDRGLVPGEHTYHRYTGLRRATQLLTDRRVDVRELLVGPITSDRLKDVQLVILNLPSMDRPPWLTSEIDAIEKFIRQGGGMIFITDHSNCYYHQYHLLPLWQRLGLTPTFETACERTDANKLAQGGPGWLLVRDFLQHPVTENVRFFATQTGGRVVGDGVIARTSPNAWADQGMSPLYGEGNPGLLGDLRMSDGEEQGAQGIVLAKAIGRGRVVIIADQNALGDAQISYADNWRLWLNACNWAGQLKIQTSPLTPDQIAMNSSTSAAVPTPPPFDQLVNREPDRNAHPTLPPGSWRVECWEPLSQGKFHWGGTDQEQYYHLWCWLNRWCWTSAHQQASHPAPQGRLLFMIHDTDLDDPAVKQQVSQAIAQRGKVVILHTGTAEVGELKRSLVSSLPKEVAELLAGQWIERTEPLKFVQFDKAGASLVVILDASILQNAQFPAPEVSPNAGQTKWQRQLFHWLFEQP